MLTICGLSFTNPEKTCNVITDLVKTCFKELEAIIKHIVESAPLLKDRVSYNIFNNIIVKFIEVKRSSTNRGKFYE